jgi:hypothetical protein
MSGMGGGWQIPLLIVVLVIVAGIFFARNRTRESR